VAEEAGIFRLDATVLNDPYSKYYKDLNRETLQNQIITMEELEQYQQIYVTLFTLFIMARVFRLISKFVKNMKMYLNTLIEVISFLRFYLLVFLSLVMSFALLLYIYYGSKSDAFSTITSSLTTIIMLLL
jgi:hypothetical protein